MECHKNEKDGTPKKSFAGRRLQYNPLSRRAPCKQKNRYMQLSAKIAKLEKSYKKLKRVKKKRKREYLSDSNDSDSS